MALKFRYLPQAAMLLKVLGTQLSLRPFLLSKCLNSHIRWSPIPYYSIIALSTRKRFSRSLYMKENSLLIFIAAPSAGKKQLTKPSEMHYGSAASEKRQKLK